MTEPGTVPAGLSPFNHDLAQRACFAEKVNMETGPQASPRR